MHSGIFNSQVSLLLMAMAYLATTLTSAQGVKGGSSSFISSSNQQQFAQPSSSQFSTFMERFSKLTPVQQQSFINQMSSSNKRIFQQLLQPQTSFSEEISSSSGASGALPTSFGTKSSNFKLSSSQNQVLSPVQQGYFLSQTSQQVQQPTIQPASFSFSRQVSQSQAAQPTFIPQSKEFQYSQVVNSQVQPQQQSFFNRVQQVQQVAQPVSLPSSEQSFRRVKSFSSQPLPVETGSSAFQQVFRQSVAQPVAQQGFNKFQQFSSSSGGLQPIGGFSSQFVNSTSSSLGGLPGSFSGSGFDASGFSGALQQEKVDGLDGFSNQFNLNGLQGGQNSFSSSVSSGSTGGSGFSVPGSSSFDSSISSSGFDSSDAQQRNAGIPEDFYGLTAASINNKWYIMKPVEDPNALGLGDASASSSKLRQVPLTRAQLQQATGGSGISTAASDRSRTLSSRSGGSSSSSSSVDKAPKKRCAGEEKPAATKPKASAGESEPKPKVSRESSSSSAVELDEEDEQK